MTTAPHESSQLQPDIPRALIVVESMFGNTAAVARAVADGLALEGIEVVAVGVTEAPASVPEGLALLVVGGPTHAFSLSRPSTRADAVRQGAPTTAASLGIREWLGTCRADGPLPAVAVFDTRITKVRWLPKAAGPAAARIARRRRIRLLGAPMAFLVEDIKGPLVEGELERAVAWGRSLGVRLVEQTVEEPFSRTRSA